MILSIIACIGSFIGGCIGTYFFLRNNPQKAAAINSAVSTVATDISKSTTPGK